MGHNRQSEADGKPRRDRISPACDQLLRRFPVFDQAVLRILRIRLSPLGGLHDFLESTLVFRQDRNVRVEGATIQRGGTPAGLFLLETRSR